MPLLRRSTVQALGRANALNSEKAISEAQRSPGGLFKACQVLWI
jgi:hypothetical protein